MRVTSRTRRPIPPTRPTSYAATIALPVSGAIEVTTGALGVPAGPTLRGGLHRVPGAGAASVPAGPVIVAICDNDSIHHARKVTAYLSEHPRLELLYDARSWQRGRSRSLGQVTLGGGLSGPFWACGVAVLLCCTALGPSPRRMVTRDRSGIGSACWKATVHRFVATEAGVEYTFAAGQSG